MIEKLREKILLKLPQDVFNSAYQYLKQSYESDFSHREVIIRS